MRNPPAPRCGPVDQGNRPATDDLAEHRQDSPRQGLSEARGATAHSGDPQGARAGADSIIRSAKPPKSSIRVMALRGFRGEFSASTFGRTETTMRYVLIYGLLSGFVII